MAITRQASKIRAEAGTERTNRIDIKPGMDEPLHESAGVSDLESTILDHWLRWMKRKQGEMPPYLFKQNARPGSALKEMLLLVKRRVEGFTYQLDGISFS